MEWGDVRIFLAVARAGTLGGAARLLHLSHPTIGRRLGALEVATGQVLFQRTAAGFILTEEGAAIVSLAEQMEAGAVGLARRLAGEQQKPEGTLRISSADWFGAYVLPPIVAQYATQFPFVDIEILTGTRLFNLSHREADIAFRIVPFEEPDIVQRRVHQMQYGVYVSADSADPQEGDGSGQRLVAMDSSTGTFPDIDWLKARFPNAKVVVRSNNRNVQSQICGSGLGIAVLPRPVGDKNNAIRRLVLSEAPPHRDIWMGFHRDLRRLQRLRGFVNLAVEHLANQDGL